MTQNQLTYWKNVETERANRVQEDIARTKNDIAQQQAQETQRTNLANERLRWDEHVESNRHNKKQENAATWRNINDSFSNVVKAIPAVRILAGALTTAF